mmetsp:Transcript_38742/g.91452  ORF Transcript_38742/g.91452 Transcript_38742/m.91452 type:complete len:169 (-) Transcript_38742:263-769(-)
MKPAWDKLMKEFEGHPTILVGDSDCTAGGKELCGEVGVKGYPTIKFGDPAALEDYKGGRDFDSLKKFADGLKPSCSPANIDLCDDEKKAEIKVFQDMSSADLDAKIAEKEKLLADAEENFKKEVEKLQATYKKLSEEKDATVEEVKSSGLGLMKAVKAAAGAAKKAEL